MVGGLWIHFHRSLRQCLRPGSAISIWYRLRPSVDNNIWMARGESWVHHGVRALHVRPREPVLYVITVVRPIVTRRASKFQRFIDANWNAADHPFVSTPRSWLIRWTVMGLRLSRVFNFNKDTLFRNIRIVFFFSRSFPLQIFWLERSKIASPRSQFLRENYDELIELLFFFQIQNCFICRSSVFDLSKEIIR